MSWSILLGVLGCTGEPVPVEDGLTVSLVDTFALASTDNVESVAWLPGGDGLALSSKSRKLTRLSTEGGLSEVRSVLLFTDDATESEMTSLAVAPSGSWAALTRTLVDVEGDAVVGCRGELVLVDLTDGDTFGSVLMVVPVGPMPDSVKISPDGLWIAVANERDVVWGKCDGVADVPPASVSLVSVAVGPVSATETARVVTGDVVAEREPETVEFSADGARVIATLQDSHEVAVVDVAGGTATYASLGQSALGLDPWPDGVVRLASGGYAVAGEATDELVLLDASGGVSARLAIDPSLVPADLPRDGSWGPLFEPDSLGTLVLGAREYVAMTLKACGALAVFDVTDPTAPEVVTVLAASDSGATEVLAVGSEGVAVDPAGRVLVANEDENSVALFTISAPTE